LRHHEAQHRPEKILRRRWKMAHQSDVSTQHKLIFAVEQANIDELERRVERISDPRDVEMYGKHLTKATVDGMVHNGIGLAAVTEWLRQHPEVRIVDEYEAGHPMYIHAVAPIRAWNRILGTTFYRFVHLDDGEQDVDRALGYSLPEGIGEHVATVLKATHVEWMNIGRAKKREKQAQRDLLLERVRKEEESRIQRRKLLSKTSRLQADCSDETYGPCFPTTNATWPNYDLGYVTPSLISSFYNISNSTIEFGSLGIFAMDIGGGVNTNDLRFFQDWFGIPETTFDAEYLIRGTSVVGPNISDYDLETALDVQWLTATAQGKENWFWYMGNRTDTDQFVDVLIEMAAAESHPDILSMSYAGAEIALARSELRLWNTEAIKLAAQGVTIVAASGDDGVPGYVARSEDNTDYCGYWAMFPASSKYVVAVGATSGPQFGDSEFACSSTTGGVITTGGGFSNLEFRPHFQDSVVSAFFNSTEGKATLTDPNIFPLNYSGRGYPDVAMMGADYPTFYNYAQDYVGNGWQKLYGTSASTPVFAAVLGLVNSARLAKNFSKIGWAVPALYSFYESNPEIFRDVTSGENNCGQDNFCCSNAGFFAAKGWDPLTGLGSVDVDKLVEVWSSQNNFGFLSPTPAPTHAPTYTNEAISQWAGTGDEGLFLTIDSLGLVPGNGIVDFTATISGKTFEDGDVLIFGDADWDQSTLVIKIEESSSIASSEYFTVAMVDPDLFQPGSPTFQSFIHGMWGNVHPGDTLNTTDNSANVFSWFTPTPPWGAHRYTLLLFRQTSGYLALDTMRMAAGYPTGTPNTVTNKAFFNVSSFSDQLSLDLMNGKFFYMNCQTGCQARCTGDEVKYEVYGYGAIGSVPALEFTPCEERGNLTIANVDNDGDDDSVFAQKQQWAGTGTIGTYTVLDFLHLTDEMLSHPGVNMTCEMDGVTFGPGTIQDWDTVNQSTLACHIAADDALAGKYYTLLEVDPGVPENGDNWWGVYMHGMWANFQAGQTFNHSNANVIEHAHGAPPFGSHRYTFVLFEQVDGYKDLSTYREAVTGQMATTSGHFLKQSEGAGQFARNLDLKVATATYYYQYCTASVMADVYAAEFGYGDGSTCLAYCSFDPDGSACTATSNTNLYYKPGCPCKDATFGDAYESAVPSTQPSAAPTRKPTAKPTTGAPTTPSPTSTPSPTASDLIHVDVHLSMTSTASYVPSYENSFKTAVASAANIEVKNIGGMIVVSDEDQSRRLNEKLRLSGGRLLTSTYTWTIYFTIHVDLSDLNDDSVTDASSFATVLDSSFSSGLEGALQSEGLPVTAVTSIATSAADDDDDDDDKNSANNAQIYEAVFIPLGFIIIFAVFYFMTNRKYFDHCKKRDDSPGRKEGPTTSGFAAFETADTQNPIVHSSAEEIADTRTRGLTKAPGQERSRSRGESTVNHGEGL
jgi:tripeptidyl-peptidase-1